ncbi:hypothetical protein RAS1_18180 [Phycisphaerae bacterium RAS1]|nr:hypothetical protein RAS1_18180 [Phycisphaerae bacterium RAS1]
MKTRRAITLVELLTCIAIIVALLAILLPTITRAKSQARRVKCMSNLRQLGAAFHMYAGDHLGRAMPLAYTDNDVLAGGDPVYWWGASSGDGVDHTRGFTWPYLNSDLRAAGIYECPEQPVGSYLPQGASRSVTSTYGYNGYYLSPPHTPGWSISIGRRPWQMVDTLARPQLVFAFADTALDVGLEVPQNCALLDPPFLFSNRRWHRNDSPTTSFRHAGRTVVVCADGHAVACGLEGGRMASPSLQIGSVGLQNGPHYVPDWRDW